MTTVPAGITAAAPQKTGTAAPKERKNRAAITADVPDVITGTVPEAMAAVPDGITAAIEVMVAVQIAGTEAVREEIMTESRAIMGILIRQKTAETETCSWQGVSPVPFSAADQRERQ